jgi:hypothetical protein
MPFKSKKQKNFLKINKPKIYKKWKKSTVQKLPNGRVGGKTFDKD